jgi:hypothetical protein
MEHKMGQYRYLGFHPARYSAVSGPEFGRGTRRGSQRDGKTVFARRAGQTSRSAS